MSGKPARPGVGKDKRTQTVIWSVVGGFVVFVCAIGVFGGDSDTSVPAPAADERSGTVPILKAATDSQGICYGWELLDVYDDVSVGSNLGDGTTVIDAPGCPRWIAVSANVRYTSSSSESEDYATIQIKGSEDIEYSELYAIETGLGRFGLDGGAFLADPGWAVTRAATILPLLAAERGLAGPAAPPAAGPSTPSAPLPDAGSDFWRDRWLYILSSAALFLLAALFIAVGVRQRRRHRGGVPAQRAGAGAAGRTRSIR
ncbi:hypothetical protein [Micromonospora sp. NPDC048887]|uniref:hypothetical protein n=1 Tax=unclassified Micromonospora TaxID=2617518 RepID=UPI0033F1197A